MSNPDIDSAFDNMAHVSGSAALPGEWAQRAASFRAKWHDVQTDLPYGPDERQCFDLFLPAGAPGGLVVFVHGGYWMRLDKSYWSHLAEGALSRGWAMAIFSYSLILLFSCPFGQNRHHYARNCSGNRGGWAADPRANPAVGPFGRRASGDAHDLPPLPA